MPAGQVVVDETVLAAVDQRYHAEQWGRRRTKPEAIRTAAQPDMHSLSYLVFDGHKLVAAFALRDDAQQWIEEFGHSMMKLREMNKRGKAARPNMGGR
ncbi:MAG: hypothetical protein JO071_10280 [Deltaproteobacteria bacterium]|nr:hypothetical protein [Deltaproteobacteria bacterium]